MGIFWVFMYSSLFSNCKLIASAYTFYCKCESEEMRDELLRCALLHFIVSFFLMLKTIPDRETKKRECREVVSPVKLIMQLFFLLARFGSQRIKYKYFFKQKIWNRTPVMYNFVKNRHRHTIFHLARSLAQSDTHNYFNERILTLHFHLSLCNDVCALLFLNRLITYSRPILIAHMLLSLCIYFCRCKGISAFYFRKIFEYTIKLTIGIN